MKGGKYSTGGGGTRRWRWYTKKATSVLVEVVRGKGGNFSAGGGGTRRRATSVLVEVLRDKRGNFGGDIVQDGEDRSSRGQSPLLPPCWVKLLLA